MRVQTAVSVKFDVVPPSTRTVLRLLSKPRLVELSRELGVVVRSSASKDDQLAALARKAKAPLQQILRSLGRDELKLTCRQHGLDDRGRSREELSQRILKACRGASDSPAATSSTALVRVDPAKGDIAIVRQRQYLVTEVVAPAVEGSMTRVRLVCLDDDAQGRTLEVLWELELGARILQAQAQWSSSVERLDEPRQFAAYFHALKWNGVTATDGRLFQAPFHAGIALKSYQLTPLRKALELPRANLFIADDVGLGKTIEAGLVVQELLLRQRIDFVLVVCPASVNAQWKNEMERRFGLGFEIYNREFVMRRRQERGFQVNPWSTHNRFIVSYQTFRRPEYRDALLNLLENKRKKSLLVLDEAHNAAPASASKYACDTLTTKAIRDLTGRFENRLFLSATPHNGHSNSFSALLEMLDPQRFLRGTVVTPEQLAPVMVRRLKSDLVSLGQGSGFPERKLVQIDLLHEGKEWQARALRDDGPAQLSLLGGARPVELELSRMLAEYTALVGPRSARARFVFINLQKRLLSSVEAFARTLAKHADKVKEAQTRAQSQTSAAFAEEPDDSEEGLSADAQDAQLELSIEAASASLARSEGNAAALLEQMLSLARQHRNAPDAKARALVAWIRSELCPAVSLDGSHSKASKRWSERRVLVFAEYGHTKTYLRKLLDAACEGTDKAEERVRFFDGGMSEENRALIQEAFNGDPDEHPVRILIATDAAREGVNLQGHCADLFHYDIPWNPGRLEQRNGRIDRTLQPAAEVRCHYFFYPQRAEDEVLRAVVRKVGQIQRELGSVGAVVFDGIADLLDKGGLHSGVLASLEAEEQRVRQSSKAAKELEQARSRDLGKDFQQVERILNQSKKVLELDSALLRDAIDVGLAWAGAPPLAAVASPKEERGLATYKLPALSDSWSGTLDSARPARRQDESLREWRSRAPLPVVFDAPQKLSTPVVQLHLKHPIVQRILSRFLAQGYSAHDLSRVTVLRNPKDAVPRVIALGRISIFGHGATRLHDRLVAVAAAFGDGAKLVPCGEEE
ncbi:MAG TPA: DISARM system SNF2-like helicase DrmD, partial [Polyangiaceae bacterium]|nr:DISARM system SNF2-like helicase DrmD [Polyangiaceae bacterium]